LEHDVLTQRSDQFLQKLANHRQKPPEDIAAATPFIANMRPNNGNYRINWATAPE
jgi:hypothetical protein